MLCVCCVCVVCVFVCCVCVCVVCVFVCCVCVCVVCVCNFLLQIHLLFTCEPDYSWVVIDVAGCLRGKFAGREWVPRKVLGNRNSTWLPTQSPGHSNAAIKQRKEWGGGGGTTLKKVGLVKCPIRVGQFGSR